MKRLSLFKNFPMALFEVFPLALYIETDGGQMDDDADMDSNDANTGGFGESEAEASDRAEAAGMAGLGEMDFGGGGGRVGGPGRSPSGPRGGTFDDDQQDIIDDLIGSPPGAGRDDFGEFDMSEAIDQLNKGWGDKPTRDAWEKAKEASWQHKVGKVASFVAKAPGFVGMTASAVSSIMNSWADSSATRSTAVGLAVKEGMTIDQAEALYDQAVNAGIDFENNPREGDDDAWMRFVKNSGGAGLPGAPAKTSMEAFADAKIPGLDGKTVGDMYKGRFNTAEGAKGELEEEKANWQEFTNRNKELFANIAKQYDEEIAGIPKLNVNVGEMFGGARIPMSPGKHIRDIGIKRDARETGLTRAAGIESTGLANITNNVLNRYNIGHKQYDDPIQEALDIQSQDKSEANQLRMAQMAADSNEGSIWEAIIPAVAYGALSYSGGTT